MVYIRIHQLFNYLILLLLMLRWSAPLRSPNIFIFKMKSPNSGNSPGIFSVRSCQFLMLTGGVRVGAERVGVGWGWGGKGGKGEGRCCGIGNRHLYSLTAWQLFSPSLKLFSPSLNGHDLHIIFQISNFWMRKLYTTFFIKRKAYPSEFRCKSNGWTYACMWVKLSAMLS